MSNKLPPWDQRIARILVRPLARTPITPNQLTLLTMALALAGAGLFTIGDPVARNWGAGLFVLARFLDHFDGELARLKNMTSKLGYYLDYIAGGASYAALFMCMGIGFRGSELGNWAIVLGLVGAISAVVSVFTGLGIDRLGSDDGTVEAVGYPGIAGFELEDGMYLLAPLTWAGYLYPFFIVAGIGAGVYCLWTCWSLVRLRQFAAEQPHE
jgi:archaetidylinositol phosphate synthase